MKVRLLALVVALSVGLSLAACGSRNPDQSAAGDSSAVEGTMESDAENVGATATQKRGSEEDADSTHEKREKATSVDAARAFRGDLVLPVVAEGSIRARNSAEIRAEIAGRIVQMTAHEGQTVRRGQLIVKLDDREYEAAAEEARAQYLQALSLLSIEEDEVSYEELAKSVREEFSNLEKQERQGQITRAERIAREVELDMKAIKNGQFRYEVAAARSGVSVARAGLERARVNLERAQIRAPFDGVLSGLTLSSGEHITAGQTICTIVDNVNLEAEVGVLEADLGNVTVGKPALLTVPALNQTYTVTVDVISPQFDRETRTCQVLLRMRNDDGRLRAGMFIRARVAGETFRDRLLVPREAILTRDGRPLLFKVEGDHVQWLYVQLGKANDYLVEIDKVLQGGALEPEDKVVVSDHLTLAHDAKIKVKKLVAPSDPWVAYADESR